MPSMPHTRSRARGASCWTEGGGGSTSSSPAAGLSIGTRIGMPSSFISCSRATLERLPWYATDSNMFHMLVAHGKTSRVISSTSDLLCKSTGPTRALDSPLDVVGTVFAGFRSGSRALCACAAALAVRTKARSIMRRLLQSGRNSVSFVRMRANRLTTPGRQQAMKGSTASRRASRSGQGGYRLAAARRSMTTPVSNTTKLRSSTPMAMSSSGARLLWGAKEEWAVAPAPAPARRGTEAELKTE
ncbi:hypothetical protein V8C86DRAFT_2476913 [Haematococcus lacustris]